MFGEVRAGFVHAALCAGKSFFAGKGSRYAEIDSRCQSTGKAKALINAVNSAYEASSGAVVCLEQGEKLRYDIRHQVRLINTLDYMICDGQSLFGFIAGIYASNHDITDIFVDSALKICENNYEEFKVAVDEIARFAEANKLRCTITASMPLDELCEDLKKYLNVV